jgi:hypothetical protein
MDRNLARAACLGLLFAGGYYFNFFLWLGDGNGIYLSADYRRIDLVVATTVAWAAAAAMSWAGLALLARGQHRPHARWLGGLLGALWLAAFVRCYSKMAGVTLVDYVAATGIGHVGRYAIPVALVLPFAALLLGLAARPRLVARTVSLLAWAGLVVLPVGLMRMVQTPVGRVHDAPRASAPAPTTAERRVVWVVMDEFDPGVAFDGRLGPSPVLPHFKRLMGESLVARAAASPSNSTDLSIPSMLIGEATTGNRYGGPGRLAMQSAGGRSIPFDIGHTVIGRIEGGPARASILGFYHPYCEVLPVATCHSRGTAMGTGWFDGLANLLPKKITGLPEPMTRITQEQLALLPRYAGDATSRLTFIHLNVPHLPAEVAHARYGRKPAGASDDYKLNLRLADDALGVLRAGLDSAPAEQRQLLVMTSDHWYRNNGARQSVHPSLLIVKLRHDSRALVMDQPVSLHHVAKLATEFLDGRLATHDDIRGWYLAQPFVSPFTKNGH